MFWKTGQQKNKKRTWSITNKLTTFYTLTIFGIFLFITTLLYFLLFQLIDMAERQYLIDEIHILGTLLKEQASDLSALTQEVNAVPAALKDASYRYYVKIVDKHGTTLMQTPDMETLHITNFPLLTENWEKKIHYFSSLTGKKYILITGPIDNDKTGQVSKIAHIALDISYQEQLMAQYRNSIIILLFIVILITFVVSRIITKKGLKSLYAIVPVTEAITKPPFLHSTIQTEDWPRELKPIGLAYNNMIIRIDEAFSRLSRSMNELAHEIRTPLNNLMGEAELVLLKPRALHEYQRVIGSSLEEYNRLSILIKNILFLARADNPVTVIQKEPLNLEHEIRKITDFCELAASEKEISIEVIGQATLSADKGLLYRVMYNLLDNALKYTASQGKISIQIQQEHPWMRITIKDNGIGIEEKYLSSIFDPFYRISNEASKSQGLGLGLSIVKSIMHLHAGKIEVHSKMHVGTTFNLYFPSIKSVF